MRGNNRQAHVKKDAVVACNKVYAYLRVSTTLQVDKGGFHRQLKAIKHLCTERKYVLTGIYREKAVSGSTDGLTRPAFQEMITSILSDGVKTIIIESLDRLARELMVQEQILMYLISKGISLISANTGEIVTEAIQSDPMKKALVRMQSIFAELDKGQTVMRLRKGRERVRQLKGKCEGGKHYGETSQTERDIIKRIQRMRRLWRGGTKRMSYDKIAKALNAEGIKTKRGKLWTSTGVLNVLERKRKRTKKKGYKETL